MEDAKTIHAASAKIARGSRIAKRRAGELDRPRVDQPQPELQDGVNAPRRSLRSYATLGAAIAPEVSSPTIFFLRKSPATAARYVGDLRYPFDRGVENGLLGEGSEVEQLIGAAALHLRGP